MSGVGSRTTSRNAIGLLDLLAGDRRGTEVGDRRGHDDHVGLVAARQDGVRHLLGGVDADDLDAGRRTGDRWW